MAKSKSEEKRLKIQGARRRKFSFPAHKVTIEAEDLESAQEKLKAQLSNSKTDG